MLRCDIIEAAGKRQNILFPIFTNGTYIDDRYLALFDRCRNLIPIMSIEGNMEVTDARRGKGIYDRLMSSMDAFQEKGLIFGASVTVTTENIKKVSSESFIKSLSKRGCKVVFFVEFVPVTEESRELAPEDSERNYLAGEIGRLINSHGGAELCPFSPYSDVNVRDKGLKEAMNSTLFTTLRSGNLLVDDHRGGCVLYEKREQVQALLS